MKSSKVIAIARKMGIENASLMSKEELIRTIQSTEGNVPCFGTEKKDCAETNCCWREDCVPVTTVATV